MMLQSIYLLRSHHTSTGSGSGDKQTCLIFRRPPKDICTLSQSSGKWTDRGQRHAPQRLIFLWSTHEVSIVVNINLE